MNATNLTCEYATNPLGIEAAQPRLGWILAAEGRGQRQTAYQIIVASTAGKLAGNSGDVWNSRKVKSDQSFNVPYGGGPLASGQTCWWKVKVWSTPSNVEGDAAGKAGDWCEPAMFEMGLLDKSDWQGGWIGTARGVPTPLLRKTFKLPGKPKKARLYVSGIGWSEAYLNGQKVSDRVLDPCASEYGKSVYYVVHDVTGQLKRGDNAIGLWLGNGWYSEPEYAHRYGDCPRALVQLQVEMSGGKRVVIASDESWTASGSCIVQNDFWHGEIYDARLEQTGWSTPRFDDSAWVAAEAKDAPGPVPNRPAESNGWPDGAVLRAMIMPPIRVIETRKPVRFTEPQPNVYLYDFGQLFGGWARVRVKGPAGTKLTIKYSGRMYEETGLIDKRRHEPPMATDYYILKGDPEGEEYSPRFTYHPVHYVQIEGAPAEMTIHDIDGCVVHSDVDLTGDFECSNDVVNQVHTNTVWTLRNGLFGMPLDCLHREHWAWTDPATITGSLYPRKNMPAFWTKWMRDIADSQAADGQVPHVAPAYHGEAWDSAWGGNYPQLVWYLHQYFGDDRLLEEHFEGMKRVVDYQENVSEGWIIVQGRYGDHMLPGSKPGTEEFISSETPRELVWTGYFYRGALAVAQAAEVLGKAEEAAKYAQLARNVKDAFNARWLDTDTGVYDTGSQTSQAFPLLLDIVPGEHRQSVIDCLIASITEQYDNHHHTGNTGTTCLIDLLAKIGHGEVMYKIVTHPTYPGWGFMVAEGATTIWESWSLIAGCGNAESMIMWATIDEFFYNDIAGIVGPEYYGPTVAAGGFREIELAPHIFGDLTKATASIQTVRGEVASGWWLWGDRLVQDAVVPVGATAKVRVPVGGRTEFQITETGSRMVWANGAYVEGVDGILSAEAQDDAIVFTVGSGKYNFTVSNVTE